MEIQKSFVKNQKEKASGILYLVATPIGNLEDMTMRAIRILKEVMLIAAEDTRQTRKLLTHFQISTKLVSYHSHNIKSRENELIDALKGGGSIALVSDAGLPNISDPGYELVVKAIAEDIRVVPIPGANAALTALIASGLATDRFMFVGFLPREKKRCELELTLLQQVRHTLLFYESPHRLEKTLSYMELQWGGSRHICVARELTKTYEEFIRGTLSDCLAHVRLHKPIGELCIVVEGYTGEVVDDSNHKWHGVSMEQHMQQYLDLGDTKKEAIKKVAKDRKLPKREVYQTQIKK